MNFSERLIELRKVKGWSQEELGDKLEVSRQTISKWELGQTTPEMNKLVEMSSIFEISIDEMLDNKNYNSEKLEYISYRHPRHYEYKSKRKLFGLPLVHVNIGTGMYKAKGIIAIGNIAIGIISLGFCSIGLLSIGLLSLGLFALGCLSMGIISLGAICVGIVAIGGIAKGIFAVGGLSFGIYSIGGCAIAKDIAMGGYASGEIAIGNMANGAVEFITTNNNFSSIDATEVKQAILTRFPNIWSFIVNIFTAY